MSDGLTNLLDYDAGYLAGVKATRAAFAREEPVMTFAGLTLDRARRTVTFGKTKLSLAPTHFVILELLMTGRMVSHETLVRNVYPGDGRDVDEHNVVKVQVCKLRRLLPPNAIVTHWGQGYSLNASAFP